MDASARTSRLKDRVIYSNTLSKQLLVNQGRFLSWRNPQMTSGSMTELIDDIKGELATTPAEQKAVIDTTTVKVVVPPFPFELQDYINMQFMTAFNTGGVPAQPDFNQISTWRNVEIVSPLNAGPFNAESPDDVDSDVWLNEQMGGSSLAALSSQCSGKAVLIQRGFNNFTTKIQNAVTAGAKMVILYNSNQPGDANFRITITTLFTIPIFTIWNSTGHKILSYLRSNRKLYATVESLAYSPADSYMRLRVTEEQTVPPTVSYPLIFTGALQATLTNGYTGITSVKYNFTASKSAVFYFVNTANNERIAASTYNKTSYEATYSLVCGRQYKIMNSIAQEIADPITRPPISSNPTILLKSPSIITDTTISAGLRNVMTVNASVNTVITFYNAATALYSTGFIVRAGDYSLYLEQLNSTTNQIDTFVPYNTRMKAVDLNTGAPVNVSFNNGTTSVNNYEFVRYSCLITNVSVVGTTLTFTSEKSIVVDIVKNPDSDSSRIYIKSSPIVAGDNNTIGVGDLTSGTYGIFDATTSSTWGTTAAKQLATFTIP